MPFSQFRCTGSTARPCLARFPSPPLLLHCHVAPPVSHRLCPEWSQAHERLVAMNDPAKGGSAYLQQKVTAARDTLVEVGSPGPEATDNASK